MTEEASEPAEPLPPRPDRASGYPRPPKAPILYGHPGGEGARERRDRARLRPPPPGEGPILEWYCTRRRYRLGWAGAMGVLTLVPLTFMIGPTWFSVWPTVISMVIGYAVTGIRHTAGADWFMNRRFVRTYELVSVKISHGDRPILVLKDAAGRKAITSLSAIEEYPPLWDLVYNGIRHSVRAGARTNRRARESLRL